MVAPFAFVGLTLFFILSIFYDCDTQTAVMMLIVFAAALAFSVIFKQIRKAKILPAVFASGVVAFALLVCFNSYFYEPLISLDGRICDIKIQVTDNPDYNYGKFYYPSRIVAIGDEKVDFKARILLSEKSEARPYDFIEGKFKLYALGSSDESYLNSYKSSGTYLGAFSTDGNYTVEKVNDIDKPFMFKIVSLRSAIKEAIMRILPNEYGSLAVAILLGDRSGLSAGTLKAFENAGVIHIICVSGLHLSVWGLLVLNILRKIGVGQKLSSILTMLWVILFMMITGFNYSVVRAGIMMLVFLFSDIILKRRDSLNSLGFAVTVMAVIDPFCIGSVSLQLSVLSTLGIILCSRYILNDAERRIKKIKNDFIEIPLNAITKSSLITFSAILFTLPVTSSFGNGFSFAGFISNLLIVWAAGYAMVLCSLGAVIGCFSTSIFNFPGFLGGFLCKYIIGVAKIVEKIGFLKITISENGLFISLTVTLIFAFLSVIIVKRRENLKMISAAICALIFFFSIGFSAAFEYKETRISVADIGDGTYVMISKNGDNLLVGSNPGDDYLRNNIYNIVGGYSKIDAFLRAENSFESNGFSYDLINRYDIKNIYSHAKLPNGKEIKNGEYYSSGSICFSSYKTENATAVYVETEDLKILICTSASVDIKQLPPKFAQAQIIISRNYKPFNSEATDSKLLIITADKSRGRLVEKYVSDKGRKCYATGGMGNISVRGRKGYFSFERC